MGRKITILKFENLENEISFMKHMRQEIVLSMII
jgi:hypothetical protein